MKLQVSIIFLSCTSIKITGFFIILLVNQNFREKLPCFPRYFYFTFYFLFFVSFWAPFPGGRLSEKMGVCTLTDHLTFHFELTLL